MEQSPTEFPKSGALIRLKSGKILLGHGPFNAFPEPPPHQISFYINSFELDDPYPWKVPSFVSELSESSFLTNGNLRMVWHQPDDQLFASVFHEIKASIAEGKIDKAVPVVVQEGELTQGSYHQLPQLCLQSPAYLHAYGFWDQDSGFCGATPETLLTLHKGCLETMALAGTATSKDETNFICDKKESQEHEFVVATLQEVLSPLGQLTCSERRVLHLGEIIHLLTTLRLTPTQELSANDWVRLLHPTPALGIKPKTAELLHQLMTWRTKLGCPPYFGSPFGVMYEDELTVYVAIRNIQWDKNRVKLSAGCGIVRDSMIEKEWAELALKRHSILQSLGLFHSSETL